MVVICLAPWTVQEPHVLFLGDVGSADLASPTHWPRRQAAVGKAR